jgi:hypothetical protein
MSLKQRGSSETEANLRQVMKEVGDHCLRHAPARLPSASSAVRRLLLLPAMVLGAALVIWNRKLEVGKDLKAKGLVKSWGTYGFIYRTGEKDRGLRS